MVGCSKGSRSLRSNCLSKSDVLYLVLTLYIVRGSGTLSPSLIACSSLTILSSNLCAGISFCCSIINLVIYSTIFYSTVSVIFEPGDLLTGVSAVSSQFLCRLAVFKPFDEVFFIFFFLNFFDLVLVLCIGNVRLRLYSW
jgi:hypothetical protein